MTAPTHQAFGLTLGLSSLIVNDLAGWHDAHVLEIAAFLSLAVIGSLLPDLDTPHSKMGRRIPFILLSIPMYLLFGHRTITHSLFFVVVTLCATLGFFFMLHLPLFPAMGLVIGVLSHVIGDFFFEGGIPVLYPKKQRYKPVWTLKTKGIGEFLLRSTLIFTNVGLFCFFLYTSGYADWLFYSK